jgi:hypothetical protein
MAEESLGHHRVSRPTAPTVIVFAVVAAVFFSSGFFTSRLLDEGRVRERSAERFDEFLSIEMDLGFVTVDRQKLAELICIAAEAEWEDGDADERAEAFRP